MTRSSGILLHITSLPSPYGIGNLGQCAREFVDFLQEAKQHYWQILPISPTGYGDSPYQSASTFAGNPYLLDPEPLVERGPADQGGAGHGLGRQSGGNRFWFAVLQASAAAAQSLSAHRAGPGL